MGRAHYKMKSVAAYNRFIGQHFTDVEQKK